LNLGSKMYPIKYNPIRVMIKKLNKPDIIIDDDYGTPVGGNVGLTRDDAIEIEAQINLGNKKYFAMMRAQDGDKNLTQGHLFISKNAMDLKGFSVAKGDKIVEVGPAGSAQKFNSIITEVRPESPLNGDFLFIVAEFEEDKDQHTP